MKKELLFSVTKKDFFVQTFTSGGPGGQHQNKTESGVRIIHRESGAVGEARDERSQHHNKKIAFRRLIQSKKFKIWHSKKVFELTGKKTLDEKVSEMMDEKYIKIEVKNEHGQWVEKDLLDEA